MPDEQRDLLGDVNLLQDSLYREQSCEPSLGLLFDMVVPEKEAVLGPQPHVLNKELHKPADSKNNRCVQSPQRSSKSHLGVIPA